MAIGNPNKVQLSRKLTSHTYNKHIIPGNGVKQDKKLMLQEMVPKKFKTRICSANESRGYKQQICLGNGSNNGNNTICSENGRPKANNKYVQDMTPKNLKKRICSRRDPQQQIKTTNMLETWDPQR